jgi:hypothetical protein
MKNEIKTNNEITEVFFKDWGNNYDLSVYDNQEECIFSQNKTYEGWSDYTYEENLEAIFSDIESVINRKLSINEKQLIESEVEVTFRTESE